MPSIASSLLVLWFHAPRAISGLEWIAPPECPQVDEVRGITAYHLGVEGIEDPRDDLRATARVTTTPGGFHLELRLSSATSLDESEADAETCDVLAEIVGLKVALALDPATVVEEIREPHEDVETPPAIPPGPTPVPTDPDTSWRFAASALGGMGVLTDFDAGARMDTIVAHRRFRGRAYATYLATTPAPIADTSTFSLFAVGGGLEGCVAPAFDQTEFPICAGARALAIRGEGRGLSVDTAAWRPHVAITVGPNLVWPRKGPVALTVGVQAAVPVLRPRFGVEPSGVVFSSSPVAGLLSVGIEVRPQR